MAVEKSYARLGLFLVVTLVVVFATALFFIQRMKSREVIDLVTYTTGNVTGLEVGSPVRFRGVPIGRVEALRIDQHGSLIEVDFEVFLDRLYDVSSDVERVQRLAATGAFPHFRASIVSNPVTGDSYLFMDIPPNPPPPIALTFTPTRVYVPYMPTILTTAQDRLPELLERSAHAMQTLETILNQIPDSLERSNRFFNNMERVVETSDLPALSAESRTFFATTSAQIHQITSDLHTALGPDGTLERFAGDMRTSITTADLAGTTQRTREAMNQTNLAADDLRRNLPAIRDSLAQLRDLARLLADQPEAVLYGTHQQKAKR
jgi:phospholipid/cholesterol/gamma-HCH transport system substrate-binding protein